MVCSLLAARTARALLAITLVASAPVALAFDFDDVATLARRKAAAPYQAPDRAQPKELELLGYDRYRDIRFRPDRAIWRAEGLPFDLMFFHRAQSNPRVRMNAVVDDKARHLPYDSDDFDFGKNTLSPEEWGELDYAGLRVHYHLNGPQYKDELIVFLGASYFRALAAGTRYGLSARGLAVDTIGGQGEEFPYFPEFWIVKPEPDARTLRMFALLESERVSGAFQFDVTPGDETVVEVHSRLYLRGSINTLGIAPLTSMYQFGENQPHRVDFRPEVHDSDGLMVATGDGEWLWRPLINPNSALTTSFSMREVRGFGLMQRDRSFTSYEDPETRYDLRPSAWVEPLGSWGAGRVELVQLHTPNETNDNIVAYWVPERLPAPGEPVDFSYRLHWQGARLAQQPPGGRVIQSRVGRGYRELADDQQQFMVDFMGPTLAALPPDAPVKAVVSAPVNGEILETNAYHVEATGAWRMMVLVKQLDTTQALELRGYLQNGADVLTETWSNVVPPR
ncbi:MAG TPA: glucan biosynthesis protein G [Gammaproteobacteria bacterium]|nr:glucan biosynthesis protein G [Gammaproteobacteria bacterium]